jgi:hypothetical protein
MGSNARRAVSWTIFSSFAAFILWLWFDAGLMSDIWVWGTFFAIAGVFVLLQISLTKLITFKNREMEKLIRLLLFISLLIVIPLVLRMLGV